MSKILIAGAGGFIGGYMVSNLISKGVDVRAVDIKPISNWFQVNQNAENLSLDLREKKSCQLSVNGISEVYNFASDMGGMGFIEVNKAISMISVLINTHLIMASVDSGVDKYFYASSACVYNKHKQKIINFTPLKEEDAYPAFPEDGYGWEKLFSEHMCNNFCKDFGLNVRIARFHNVYGPYGTWTGGREKAPAAICRKVIEAKYQKKDYIDIWGDGSQLRTFLYIDDCIHGINLLMNGDLSDPLNLGSSELVCINDLVSITEKIAGIKLKRIYNLSSPIGVMARSSDNSKFINYFGWEPSIPLKEGLKKTYEWIENEYIKQN